jgi:hypothetical protein
VGRRARADPSAPWPIIGQVDDLRCDDCGGWLGPDRRADDCTCDADEIAAVAGWLASGPSDPLLIIPG